MAKKIAKKTPSKQAKKTDFSRKTPAAKPAVAPQKPKKSAPAGGAKIVLKAAPARPVSKPKQPPAAPSGAIVVSANKAAEDSKFKISVRGAKSPSDGGKVVLSVPPRAPVIVIKAGEIKRPEPAPQPVSYDSRHIYFTLEDLAAYLKGRENNITPKLSKKDFGAKAPKKLVSKPAKKAPKGVVKLENKSVGVATLFDILGFNPVETPSVEKLEARDVPRKWKKYYNKLVELRAHHSEGVNTRSQEVMKHSDKEDSGDLSSNGQHLADAGSASFERDLAYNMITNQTEILAEIDAAIKRIKDGTYGICEVTGKPIPEARLSAIPFARYTKEGQEIHELEQKRAKAVRRDSGVFDMGIESQPPKPEDEDAEADI